MANSLYIPPRRYPIRIDFLTRDEELAESLTSRLDRLEIFNIPSRVHVEDLVTWEPKVTSYLVTPGNSFGIMSGGFDRDVCVKFESLKTVEETVQDNIKRGNMGELPVGMATLVLFKHLKWDGLIYAPTMRVPHVIPDGSDAPYVATRAALLMFAQHMERQHPLFPGKHDSTQERGIVFTGMGTGTGEVPAEIAAEQMILAIERFSAKMEVTDLFQEGMDLHKQLTYWSRG